MSKWTGPNDEAIEAWNGILFDKFVRFRDTLTNGLASHGDVALERHPPRRGARVLDVGCGFGDTTFAMAKLVGPEGRVLGVDAAERFIVDARQAAAKQNVSNVEFAVADVQSGALGGPFDHAFSRFGTMFFASPVAALRNIKSTLVPGGTMTMVVWRKREDNPALDVAEAAVKEILPPPPETTDEPTCGPGPFSLSGADTVSDILVRAGYSNITLERNDAPISIGRDLDDAIEFALALGPAGEHIRLAGAEGERLRPQIVTALRKVLSEYVRPNGVLAASSVWIVSARA